MYNIYVYYTYYTYVPPLAFITLYILTHSLSIASLFPILSCGVWVLNEIKTKYQMSSLNTGRFILDLLVDSSANYNIIAKEEKDPKGPYAISTCSTKLLSSILNLYMH